MPFIKGKIKRIEREFSILIVKFNNAAANNIMLGYEHIEYGCLQDMPTYNIQESHWYFNEKLAELVILSFEIQLKKLKCLQ